MGNYKLNKNGLLKIVQEQLVPKQPSGFLKQVFMASQMAGVLKILTKEQLHLASILRT